MEFAISDLCLEERQEPVLVLNNTNRDEAQWRLAAQ